MQPMKKLALAAMLFCVSALQSAFAGDGYTEIAGVQATDKPEVIEFFSFGCPHCSSLEPKLEEWLKNTKPQVTTFKRVPVVFHASWEAYAKAYYLTELLQKPELVSKIFAKVHALHQPIQDEKGLRDFFLANGVSAPQYDYVSSSFELANKMAEGKQLQRQFQIMSVPSFVINGKYLTGGSEAGSFEKMFELLTVLPVEKAPQAVEASAEKK